MTSPSRICVTGGYGFIGSHLIPLLHKTFPNASILNIDKMTYAANKYYLNSIESSSRYQHKKIDIAEKKQLFKVLKDFRPSVVYHLAAESHVDNSILSPNEFIQTNIIGTYHLIEICRCLWNNNPHNQESRFIYVSTDEVYGTTKDGFFNERSNYKPNSPYSATKASANLLVRSYVKTYQFPAIVTHSSNNFGPHQHKEKFIPTIIHSALHHQPIPIYGTGQNIRDWLYVQTHCQGLIDVSTKGKCGEIYNFGGNLLLTNTQLATIICNKLDQMIPSNLYQKGYSQLIKYVTDRPGHDFRYAIDTSKAQKKLQWDAKKKHFQHYLETTIQWYIDVLTPHKD